MTALAPLIVVITGLVPVIHAFCGRRVAWMTGTGPGHDDP
jgi:hypothetical protein